MQTAFSIIMIIVPLDIWVGVCCVTSQDLFELTLSDHCYLRIFDCGTFFGSSAILSLTEFCSILKIFFTPIKQYKTF